MSIIVSNIRVGINESDDRAFYEAKKRLNLKNSDIENIYIYKKSLDARHNNKLSYVMSVGVDLIKNESETVEAVSDNFVKLKESAALDILQGTKKLDNPIIIVGFGPAGIFCGYLLSQYGYNPIIFERGGSLEERIEKVDDFWKNGILNTKTNVQFGEGGAGTFSDGKLVTRISDPRCDYVLNEFVKHGAPKEILYNAKPHIGTDILRNVITSIRKEIIAKGGRIYFNSYVEKINIKNGQVFSISVNGQEIRTDSIVLAIGHSARDTFKMLCDNDINMENKDFSVGVRIEQLQSVIDKGLYGVHAGNPNLPKGEYQLSYRKDNRAVYTFCMCPGGLVVPSASSENTVVTNGMSYYKRDKQNANSALVVSVGKNDFGTSVLAGIEFQQKLENLAFINAGSNYSAPVLTVADFLNDTKNFKIGNVIPSYSIGVKPVDFKSIFPSFIIDYLKLGLQKFDKKLPGFSNKDGILTGVETRTSSPVRIFRNDDYESQNVKGLYPCGEGAGYAGGIMSAAVDGIKIAQKIISKYKTD